MGLSDDIYEIVPGIRTFQTTLNRYVSFVPPPPPTDPGTPRRILLVTSHPVRESFSLAIAQTIEEEARERGHEVQRIDLGLEGFRPVLTASEWKSYGDDTTKRLWRLPRDVRGYIKKLQWCDTLFLVYPTWWMNTPANLKGFFDRTLLMHHTWDLPPIEDEAPSLLSSLVPQGLTPKLTNIHRLVGVSTYGAPRSALLMAGDNGRNMIYSAVLPLFAADCTIRWHGLYEMDATTEGTRASFLEEVRNSVRENL